MGPTSELEGYKGSGYSQYRTVTGPCTASGAGLTVLFAAGNHVIHVQVGQRHRLQLAMAFNDCGTW